jgi:hypothetical protein
MLSIHDGCGAFTLASMSDPDARYQAVEVLRTKAASAYFVAKRVNLGTHARWPRHRRKRRANLIQTERRYR